MIAKMQLLRCHDHGHICCWVQLDGSHLPPHACRCFEDGKEIFECPIDGHSMRWILRNPEWTEVGR